MTVVSIVASGSRGDVQPYLALGKGLKHAGYDVRLLSSDNFAPLVTEFGLNFVSIGFSVEDRIQSEEWLQGQGKQRLKHPCFWVRPDSIVLPAFGSFTGTMVITVEPGDSVYLPTKQSIVKLR